MASNIASHIIWQNADKTVRLIDIPASVAAAQGTASDPCNDYLISSKPLQTAFPSIVPGSRRALERTIGNSVDAGLHASYRPVLTEALNAVKQSWRGEWCLPRIVSQQNFNHGVSGKRKRSDNGNDGHDQRQNEVIPETIDDPKELVLKNDVLPLPKDCYVTSSSPASSDGHSGRATTLHGSDDSVQSGVAAVSLPVVNESGLTTIEIQSGNNKKVFHIPPDSTFFLGDCSHSRTFHGFVRDQAIEHETRRKFDCIVLDPPWPNRSVKRTNQRLNHGAGYQIAMSLREVENLVLGMDLDMLMERDCLVGIWITNKAAVRELVLGEGGIFATWGVTLLEEWVWLKTTVLGEPVVALDNTFRKPYEVFLLGQRCSTGVYSNGGHNNKGVKITVMFGVPDLHSRKPCLQVLIDELLGGRSDRRVLEVFGRHLVAGWWSWGNECLKFNAEGHWRSNTHIATTVE